MALAATLLPETAGKPITETHEPAQGRGANAPETLEGVAAAAFSGCVEPGPSLSSRTAAGLQPLLN